MSKKRSLNHIHDSEATMMVLNSQRKLADLLTINVEKSSPMPCETMLRNLENVDERNSNGVTLLHCAIRVGSVEWVKTLLAAGADPGLRDAFQLTALQVADRLSTTDEEGREIYELIKIQRGKRAAKERNLREKNEITPGDLCTDDSLKEEKAGAFPLSAKAQKKTGVDKFPGSSNSHDLLKDEKLASSDHENAKEFSKKKFDVEDDYEQKETGVEKLLGRVDSNDFLKDDILINSDYENTKEFSKKNSHLKNHEENSQLPHGIEMYVGKRSNHLQRAPIVVPGHKFVAPTKIPVVQKSTENKSTSGNSSFNKNLPVFSYDLAIHCTPKPDDEICAQMQSNTANQMQGIEVVMPPLDVNRWSEFTEYPAYVYGLLCILLMGCILMMPPIIYCCRIN